MPVSSLFGPQTLSHSPQYNYLSNTGNFVLRNLEDVILWQSSDFPTDTLLPQQLLTRNTKLVSSRSQSNFSTGFYELLFDNDNLLRLLYNGPEVSSIYWFDPRLVCWDANRSTYNNSRIAVLNFLGNFSSSDDVTFMSADYGSVLHRRLTLDYDGNIRLYSWEDEGQKWVVSWQAIQTHCKIHGVCGVNSMCSYIVGSGRKCSCLPGYKMKNHTDWGYGCEPDFDFSCNKKSVPFCCYLMLNFMSMIMGSTPITPLINVEIYACNYATARHSSTAFEWIKVIQIVTLRHYCSMDIVLRISVKTSIRDYQ